MRNGRPGAAHILNVSFPGVEGESLFNGLPELALSTGSACNSRSAEPSFVLRALGRDTEAAQSSLRFSLGYGTTAAEVAAAIDSVRRVHGGLWQASPARPAPVEPGGGNWWLAKRAQNASAPGCVSHCASKTASCVRPVYRFTAARIPSPPAGSCSSACRASPWRRSRRAHRKNGAE